MGGDHGHHHSHEASREHGKAVVGRLGHAVSRLVGGHSHDAADQIDDALDADASGRRALLISLAVLALTAAVQAAVVFASGSVALLSDTLHNAVDALTAIPLLLAFTRSLGDRRRSDTPTATDEPKTWADCSSSP